jgi:hypothetical protein
MATERVYAVPGWDTVPAGPYVRRRMDCLDCHSRPSHPFGLPDMVLDDALATGVLDQGLPWIRGEAIRVLTDDYHGSADAADRIPWALVQAYRTSHPEIFWSRRAEVERAGRTLAQLYGRHVFPEMGIGWGTYPDLSGHREGTGCFRCHGGDQRSPDGAGITRDCGVCHRILALAERSPAILDALGVTAWRTNARPVPLDSGPASIYHYFNYGATRTPAR